MRTNKSSQHQRLAPTFWLALNCCVIFAYGESATPRMFSSSAFAPVSAEATSDCRRDSVAYLIALQSGDRWALDMLASSTDIKSAAQSFSIYEMGNFDKCLGVVAPKTLGAFHGEYCMTNILLSTSGENITPFSPESNKHSTVIRAAKAASGSIPLSWAFCVPSTCSVSDVTTLLDDVLSLSLAPMNATALVQSGQCSTSSQGSSMTASEIAMVSVLTFFGLLAIISTCYDIIKQRRAGKVDGTCGLLLSSFSLWTNGRKLLFGNPGESVMGCLHGLRFLSICWIIFGHTFYMSAILPIKNVEYILQLPKDWTKMVVLNETVSVDTFFLLSGLLLAYVFLKEREQGSKFSFIAFYGHRYIRLTPPYAIMIGFYATLFDKMGSGPYWETYVGKNRDYCQENWWTNLVYVNNYVNLERPCMDQTWYLAVDMQFYWVSPLLLIPLWRRKAKVLLIAAAVLLAVVPPIAITAMERLPAAMFFNDSPTNVAKVFRHVYTRAYARAGPYIVGIGMGCLLHSFKGRQIHLPKALVALGWALSIASCLAVIFGIYGMMQKDHEYSVVESSLYAGLHRTAWAASLAWVIFACCHGYGGPVNSFLSWKAMAPFSRLTYTAYLCHYVVILYNAGITRTVGYLSPYFVARDFLGNLAIALGISLVVSLVFESPFMTISKVLLRGGGKMKGASQPKLMYGSTETTTHASSQNLDEEAPSEETDAAADLAPNLEDDQKTQEIPNKHSYENRAFDAVM